MAAVKDALDPSWINAPGGVGPSYDAEELRRLQGYQLAGGATPGTSRTGLLNPRDLALSLSGGNVMVGAGGAVIGTAKGAYVCGVAAATSIGALLAADVTNPRRDRVVLRVLDPDNGVTNGTRKAVLEILDGTPNALAATGGGFPAAPAGPFIDLGYVDVPKSGAGSPSLTITAPLTAAAGAPFVVRDLTERNALPKFPSLSVYRADKGYRVDTWDGSSWSTPALFKAGQGDNTPITYGRQHSVTLNGSGVGIITFLDPFPNALSSIALVREASTGSPTAIHTLNGGGFVTNKNQVTFLCTSATGSPLAGAVVYIHVTATGY